MWGFPSNSRRTGSICPAMICGILNWKLYARNDKLYVKQYDAETNLDCHLVVDVSGSMETKNAGVSKRRYATMLAAAVAHLALNQRDAVGVTLFADRVLAHVKPRAKANQLDEILGTMVHCPGQTPAASAGVLHEVAELMPRRGLVVLGQRPLLRNRRRLFGPRPFPLSRARPRGLPRARPRRTPLAAGRAGAVS